MQSLSLGNDEWILIERMFVDGGIPAKMGLVGGQMIQVSEAIPPKPDILMYQGGFYHRDRSPVTELAAVSSLPKPYREQAEAWITANAKRKTPPAKLPLSKGLLTEDGRQVPPDRGRRQTEHAPTHIDSPEKADAVLHGQGGLREIDRA